MYEKLTRHIPMIENRQYGMNSHPMGGDDYNQPLSNMIHDVLELVDPEKDYNGMLEKAAGVDDEMVINRKTIEQIDVSMLDGDTVFSIIYYIICKEHINGGIILKFCENGCFLKWLRRLKEIDEGEAVDDNRGRK